MIFFSINTKQIHLKNYHFTHPYYILIQEYVKISLIFRQHTFEEEVEK